MLFCGEKTQSHVFQCFEVILDKKRGVTYDHEDMRS